MRFLIFCFSIFFLEGCHSDTSSKMKIERNADGLRIISTGLGHEAFVWKSDDPQAVCLINKEGTLVQCTEGNDTIIQIEILPIEGSNRDRVIYSKFKKEQCYDNQKERQR